MTSTTDKPPLSFALDNPTSSRTFSRASLSSASSLAFVRDYTAFSLHRSHMELLLTFNSHLDSFTINAVAQDDFSDVQVPDAPSQPPHTPNAGVEKPTTEALLQRQRQHTKNTV